MRRGFLVASSGTFSGTQPPSPEVGAQTTRTTASSTTSRPVPAPRTTDEFYLEASLDPQPLPVGLGFRVPLLLISPWTRGGWVTSEVSDHTSVIQFLEKWTEAPGTPVICPNISAWRRSVCGDLTGAFDFAHPVFGMPPLPDPGQPIGEPAQAHDPVPATNVMPAAEPGTKRARPLPYQPNANLDGFTFGSNGAACANLSFSNNGPHVSKASHFSIYDNAAPDVNIADYPRPLPGAVHDRPVAPDLEQDRARFGRHRSGPLRPETPGDRPAGWIGLRAPGGA